MKPKITRAYEISAAMTCRRQMSKRLRRSASRPPCMDRSILVSRIKTLNLDSSLSVDLVVQRLRDHHPDYARFKLQPFSTRVGEALHLLRNSSAKLTSAGHASSSSVSDGSRLPSGKRAMEEENVEIDGAANKNRKIEALMEMGGRNEKEIALGVEVGGRDRRIEVGPRFKDLGGMIKVLKDLMIKVIVPLFHPEMLRRLGVRPISGILLHGQPGCGKTKLAHAIANETGVPFYKISATDVIAGVSGESEKMLRDLFNKAYRTAPSIVFIDEIDVIASKRENLQKEMERRIVTQLMTCMEGPQQIMRATDSDSGSEAFDQASDRIPGYVLIIGATNRPDAIDQALRRPGRFDTEIALGVPDENARAEILSILTRNLRIESKFDCFMIAKLTPGFVGADLEDLVKQAAFLVIERTITKMLQLTEGHMENVDWRRHVKNVDWLRNPLLADAIENLCFTMRDFEGATKLVQPSTKREGFSSIPDTTWEDVGGYDSLRKEFDRYIVKRIKHPKDYEEFELDKDIGFLLYGPPGCGKTLIAKAVANESGANFMYIKGSAILSRYVGDGEKEIATIFSRAKTCSPCIIFFDEVDTLTTKRGAEGAWVVERILSELLVELDGVYMRHGIYVIGATNRPDVMDPAILRPGRFGRLFYVPLPNAKERGLILKAIARKKSISLDFDYNALVCRDACKNYSGADLFKLLNEAADIAREEKEVLLSNGILYDKSRLIEIHHFEKAFEKIRPSISKEQGITMRPYHRNTEHSEMRPSNQLDKCNVFKSESVVLQKKLLTWVFKGLLFLFS